MEEIGNAKKLWNKFKYERTQALYTPLMLCLAAGCLPIDKFLHHLQQELHVLDEVTLACEIALDCTEDHEAKVEILQLMKNVSEKIKLHESFLERFGIDLFKESLLDDPTVKYADFLKATANGKVEGIEAPGDLATPPFEKTKLAAFIFSALTARMRLYAFLGKEMQPLIDPSKGIHPHQEWIECFSSNAFQEEANQTEELLEKFSVSLTREELDIIENLYHQAMKLEVEFLLAQPLAQETYIPLSSRYHSASDRLVLCSAFGCTCTISDSPAMLAELTILTASKKEPTQSENQLDRILSGTWEQLFQQYTQEYEQCMESILVGDKAEKVDDEGLNKAFKHISAFEKQANARVIAFEVLKGLSVDDIRQSGERVIFQDGCLDFFHRVVNSQSFATVIHVISYCWCHDLIKSAFSSGGLDSVNVHANELIYENSISTGRIIANIESPMDKYSAFTGIVQNAGKDRQNLTVYIGSTIGDLPCLLNADLGIVIGASPSLIRLGAHFGVSFLPLYSFVLDDMKRFMQKRRRMEGKYLYTVSSWDEIHAFILGF